MLSTVLSFSIDISEGAVTSGVSANGTMKEREGQWWYGASVWRE